MIDVQWGDNSEHYIIWSIRGRWTANEYLQAVESANQMILSKAYDVHIIVDMQHAHAMPINLLGTIMRTVTNQPANKGTTILVSRSGLWEGMWLILNNTYGKLNSKVIFDTSMDDAVAKIKDLIQAQSINT